MAAPHKCPPFLTMTKVRSTVTGRTVVSGSNVSRIMNSLESIISFNSVSFRSKILSNQSNWIHDKRQDRHTQPNASGDCQVVEIVKKG